MTQKEYKKRYPWSVTLEVKVAFLPSGIESTAIIYSGNYVCLSWKPPQDEQRFLHRNDCRGIFIFGGEATIDEMQHINNVREKRGLKKI